MQRRLNQFVDVQGIRRSNFQCYVPMLTCGDTEADTSGTLLSEGARTKIRAAALHTDRQPEAPLRSAFCAATGASGAAGRRRDIGAYPDDGSHGAPFCTVTKAMGNGDSCTSASLGDDPLLYANITSDTMRWTREYRLPSFRSCALDLHHHIRSAWAKSRARTERDGSDLKQRASSSCEIACIVSLRWTLGEGGAEFRARNLAD